MRGRVATGEHNLAFAVRLHRVGQQDQALGVGSQPAGVVVEIAARVGAETLEPNVAAVAAEEAGDLPVLRVRIAQARREPNGRVVERRRNQAAARGRPFIKAAIRLLLEPTAPAASARRRLDWRAADRPAHAERPTRTRGPSRASKRRRPARKEQAQLQMVLEVLADVRRIDLAGHALRFQLLPRSNARQEQQLRRSDGSSAEHNFFGGPRSARCAVVGAILHARRRLSPVGTFEEHARGVSAGNDREIGPLFDRPFEKRVIGARTLAATRRGLK